MTQDETASKAILWELQHWADQHGYCIQAVYDPPKHGGVQGYIWWRWSYDGQEHHAETREEALLDCKVHYESQKGPEPRDP